MTESVGLGKNELLKWLNGTYKLNMNKVEQACTGAVYCQIIDSLHPGKVKMHKVNWKAKLEHEFINNFKILQQAFTDCKISKHIEVAKLVKGKTLDNLEFLQWMKKYFDDRRLAADYDPVSKRSGCDLEIANEEQIKKRDNSKPQSGNVIPLKSNKSEKNLINLAAVKKDNEKIQKENNNLINMKSDDSGNNINTMNPFNTQCSNQTEGIPLNVDTKISPNTDPFQIDEDRLNEATQQMRQHYQEKVDIISDENSKLKIEVNTLKISISEIGRERDFYFTKLRDMEMLAVKSHDLSKEELLGLMRTVLYSEKEIELQFDDKGKVHAKSH